MRAYRIDSEGYFVEAVSVSELTEEHVETRPPNGYHEPRYVDGEWAEGASEEHLLEVVYGRVRRRIEEGALERIADQFETSEPLHEALLYISIAATSETDDETTRDARERVETIVETGRDMRALLTEAGEAYEEGDREALEDVGWT